MTKNPLSPLSAFCALLFAICLSSQAQASFSCSTAPFEIEFNLSHADTLAREGTILGDKSKKQRLCTAVLRQQANIPFVEHIVGPNPSADGFRSIAPGLSVRENIIRFTTTRDKAGHEHEAQLAGHFGRFRPWGITQGFSGDYYQDFLWDFSYSMQYELKREAGALASGAHVITLANIETPAGTQPLDIRVRVPAPTCTVTSALQRVALT